MEEAVAIVERAIGPCQVIAKFSPHEVVDGDTIITTNNWYVAVAFRDHAPFKDKKYSVHDVFSIGCESGAYDLDYETAMKVFNDRMGRPF
jgi:hypothetical protein